MKKNFLLVFLSIVISVTLGELMLGYLRFQELSESRTAVGERLHFIFFDRYMWSIREKLRQPTESISGIDLESYPNPFSSYPAYGAPYKMHPFFDYSNVHGGETGRFKKDYFGFRNDDSKEYFQRDSDFLVIITGGSEAAGFSHEKSIAELLEISLSGSHLFDNKRVRVMNLAMNSYVLGNEINAFIHLGYNIQPNVVITHSGHNDMFNAVLAPVPFQAKGLNFYPPLLEWLPRLYGTREESLLNWGEIVTPGIHLISDVYIDNLEKYRAIAQSSGAYFIAGIQGFNEPPEDDIHQVTHRKQYSPTDSKLNCLRIIHSGLS